MTTTTFLQEILVDILLGCFSLVALCWVLVAVQSFINDRKHDKREREREKRDAEYHLERMKEIRK